MSKKHLVVLHGGPFDGCQYDPENDAETMADAVADLIYSTSKRGEILGKSVKTISEKAIEAIRDNPEDRSGMGFSMNHCYKYHKKEELEDLTVFHCIYVLLEE